MINKREREEKKKKKKKKREERREKKIAYPNTCALISSPIGSTEAFPKSDLRQFFISSTTYPFSSSPPPKFPPRG